MESTHVALVSLIAFAAFVLAIRVRCDAKSRGKPGYLAALMVLVVGSIPGLLIWLVFRPEKVTERPEGGAPDRT